MISAVHPAFVLALTANDVLFGRGAPSIENEGNVRFRHLVQERKTEYVSTGKRQMKDWIARQVIQAVRLRQGRFLRKIESLVEAERMGVPEGTTAWTFVDETTILQKVKQALRDRDNNEAAPSGSPRKHPATEGAAPNMFPGVEDPTAIDLRQRANLLLHSSPAAGTVNLSSSAMPRAGLHAVSDFLRNQQQQQQHRQTDEHARAVLYSIQSSMRRGISPLLPGGPQVSAGVPGQAKPVQGLTSFLSPNLVGGFAGISTANTGHLGLDQQWAAVDRRIPEKLTKLPPASRRTFQEATYSHETSAERALQAAYQAAHTTASSIQKDGQSSISLLELLLLQVVASHGIPLWTATNIEDVFISNREGVLSWSRLGTSLIQATQRWFQQRQNEPEPALAQEHALSLSLFYAQEIPELARKIVTLLEKLDKVSQSGAKRKSSNEEEGNGHSLDVWFQQQLSLWAASLNIANNQGRPLPYATADFTAKCQDYTFHEAFTAASILDASKCRDVWQQVAVLTRLRSIVAANPATDLLTKLDYAQMQLAGQAWDSRPSWWAPSDPAATVVRRDVFLIERVLLSGYQHVTRDIETALPAGLTKASIEDRLTALTYRLHHQQMTADEQQILDERVVQHLASLQAHLPADAPVYRGVDGAGLDEVGGDGTVGMRHTLNTPQQPNPKRFRPGDYPPRGSF
jgi:hypothetical protein